MKISAAIITSALVASATAFDKWQPWGKRDYSCLNVYQGIPDNSTLSPGQTVSLHFNRAPTTHCPDPLAEYPTGTYGVWLYNNPMRDRDTISFAQSIKIEQGINATCGHIYVKIPAKLPAVQHGDLWYLRLDTSLDTAPQMPTVYNAAGPFSITA
ncbi:uncharacterized protein N7503_011902 [Penicillium pulvis]|uniref:uncharacterized protein n=1 Tax=Penicillium pulvis TaxID=1562058 RepID=UPI00254991F7|nr:uncharacterized protein N7503_011902 [Penicillium pulvis]KAJ5786690.1 hypothetical protein N7503_011902 [Penicillium pulvis]